MIPDINLLPRLEQETENNKLFYIIIGILAAILLAVLSWLFLTANSDAKELIVKQNELQAERDQLQVQLDVLQGAKVGTLEQSLEFIEYVSYPVSPIIDETQGLLPEATYLRAYSFSNTATTITIDFESLSATSLYVERLENSPYFKDVQLGAVSTFEIFGGLDTESADEQKDFSRMPRYTANITLQIDHSYLSTGGGNE